MNAEELRDKARSSARNYYLKNRDKIIAKHKNYYYKHWNEIREKQRTIFIKKTFPKVVVKVGDLWIDYIYNGKCHFTSSFKDAKIYRYDEYTMKYRLAKLGITNYIIYEIKEKNKEK